MSEVQLQGRPEEGEEISLVEWLIAVGESKWLIAGTTAALGAVGLAVALLLPGKYSAKTVILPPQQQQSAAISALSNLGALSGATGLAQKSPDELYVAFIKSDRVLERLVDRFALKERFEKRYRQDARKKLASITEVSNDRKSGLVTITVRDNDPQFAAILANAYYEELRNMLSTLAVTEAQQRRAFFEDQVRKTQERLAAAEVSFKKAQQESGLQASQALAETSVKASVELRSQIAAREVALQALRGTYATAQNPDAVRLTQEITAMRAQLSKVERGTGRETPDAAIGGSQATLEAFRELKTQEALLEAMRRQLEIAKVDESREGPALQQAEIATSPERPAQGRLPVILGAAGVGFVLSLLFVLARHSWRSQAADSVQAERLRALRNAWKLKVG